jgi:ATP-dependent RNA helicase DDX56/DBP9
LKGKGLFFVNTIDSGYRLKLFLEQFHIRSAVLNAELPLRSRLNVIEQFNVGNFDYLIATDESTDGENTKKKNDVDEEASDEEKPKKKRKSKRKKDSEYGVSRGVDFRGVSFVVNVDFPLSPDSYTHRIGRTARGGAKGVAFSLVEDNSVAQLDMLAQVQESQPSLPAASNAASDSLQTTAPTMNDDGEEDEVPALTPQPTPLDFDLNEIEGFRYRVEDVSHAVTKNAVRETRAAELKAEIMNSQRLQSHFAENPSELQLLRHDRKATHVSKVHDHLKHVPKYLLPRGMQVAETKKRKRRRRAGNRSGVRRTDNDPLQSCDGDNVNLDGVAEDGGDTKEDEGFEDPMNSNGDDEAGDDDVGDGNGKSTSGRIDWQQKHRRGKFGKKGTQKTPLGH